MTSHRSSGWSPWSPPRFFLPLSRKSVAYQPLPFNWKPAALSIFVCETSAVDPNNMGLNITPYDNDDNTAYADGTVAVGERCVATGWGLGGETWQAMEGVVTVSPKTGSQGGN